MVSIVSNRGGPVATGGPIGPVPPRSRQTRIVAGRFAPSPTGELHLGNLRTALVAWLSARARGERFVVRMEDLDAAVASDEHARRQLDDLAAVGIDWDGPVLHQRDRFERYRGALAELAARDLTYECFCSRREIREAAAAPHGGVLAYPGTCRELDAETRRRRRREREPAIRLRAGAEPIAVDDALAGRYEAPATDVVLQRNDGTPAYNLAVVVDDAAQGVDEVVRGDDLLGSTPAQIAVQRALGLPQPRYVHVPLVVNARGERLAKRDGAVTLADLARRGVAIAAVRRALLRSIGVDDPAVAVEGFSLARLAAVGPAPVPVGSLGLGG